MNRITRADFLGHILTICTIYRASVTSWIRTAAHNAAVGGSKQSRHLDGMACDLVADSDSDNAAIINAAHRLSLDAVFEGDHIHIEADRRTD